MEKCSEVMEESFYDILKNMIGQKMMVVAARYNYRGTLSKVVKGMIVLADATAVEVTGPNNADAPQTEDPFHGSVFIKTDAIEVVCQPKWVDAPVAPA